MKTEIDLLREELADFVEKMKRAGIDIAAIKKAN